MAWSCARLDHQTLMQMLCRLSCNIPHAISTLFCVVTSYVKARTCSCERSLFVCIKNMTILTVSDAGSHSQHQLTSPHLTSRYFTNAFNQQPFRQIQYIRRVRVAKARLCCKLCCNFFANLQWICNELQYDIHINVTHKHTHPCHMQTKQ